MTTEGSQALQKERAVTRNQVLAKALRGEITWIDAAEILGLSSRQVRRIRKRFEGSGAEGLKDRRLGKPASNRIPEHWRREIGRLFQELYFDFSVLHFYEKLRGEHGIRIARYSSVKKILREQGLVPLEAPRKKHRLRRERRPMPGMLMHLDGSTHSWFGENFPQCDLVAVLDDATSEVYSARFVLQESTKSCMEVIRETIEKKGVFCALYTDRATHFVVTKKAGDRPDRTRESQIDRALSRLGTQLITAYTPQARGRMERLWRTWQGRLPQEFRLRGITTIEEANRFLRAEFVPWHNESLSVKAKSEESAFTTLPAGVDLDYVFSIQSTRVVNPDNTVSLKSRVLQIPKHPELKFCFVGSKVILHEHLDGSVSITHGPRLLVRYSDLNSFNLAEEMPKKKAA